ncbi:MAG: acetate CoA-transferase subunit alpha [Firmicutes bacterium]|nr:acetate CoA-transferase subunit alpha [Bacillota bacterium]
MKKVVGIDEAAGRVQDGMTVMIGGFLGVGTPEWLIDALLAKGVKELTVIANDTAQPERGIGKLVVGRRVKKAIVSHIGTNPETGRQMNAGELEVRLVPQGTLVEQIRAGGAGLGGVLTHTGVGTLVEEGKAKIEIGGRSYLLELPLRADVALLKAYKGDTKGNLVYRRSARNFNPVMATAADWVIAEVEKLVEPGEIDPDEVMTPGIFVDMVVERQVAENG